MYEMHDWINRKHSTHFKLNLTQYPSKRWGFVGTIPVSLTRERKDHLGFTITDSKIYDTEQEAIIDARANGYELDTLYEK